MRLLYFFLILILAGCNKTETISNPQSNQKTEQMSEQTQIIAPTTGNQGEIKGLFYGCGYNYVLNKNQLALYLPNDREVNQIETILNFTGLSKNFEVYSAPIENAVAVMIDNKRSILYDPRLLNHADTNSNFYWSSMSILAHEIGHHLQGHTLDKYGSTPDKEIEADKFSGHVLFKMGASLEQAIAAINRYGSDTDSESHPSKQKRIAAIKSGWESAAGQRYESAVPPPPADDRSFSTGDYYIDVFTMEDIVPDYALEAPNFGGMIENDRPNLEGIILDVSEDYDFGNSWSSYFELDGNVPVIKVIMQITDNSRLPSDTKEYYKVGSRKEFVIPDYYNAPNSSSVGRSWLTSLLVPGRKVTFKSFYFGFGLENIIYLKKLNR
ncbi:hypothetical protein [Chryseobacterium sp. HSC-36S06]|uniref:hypothetical protein n=1 Tax=Chryseobacterium sp. HSC-36S06 TaxID=2910970 RepID=UPI00209DD9BF|nr:hypothetical protein [Chryseobacterium sp. HSC-36S06]MCP2038174.1 hypothetical protein [Chryseobacterium sp. HSC-36S06]